MPLELNVNGRQLTVDESNPAATAAAVADAMKAHTAQALQAAQEEAKPLREAVVSRVLMLTAARTKTAAPALAELRAHLEGMTAEQLAFSLRQEEAQATQPTAPPVTGTPAGAPPANRFAVGATGAAVLMLLALMVGTVQASPSREMPALGTEQAADWAGVPMLTPRPPKAPEGLASASGRDYVAPTFRYRELRASAAPADVAPDAPADGSPSPWGLLALPALLGLSLLSNGRNVLRCALHDTQQIAITAAQAYTGGLLYQVGEQWGFAVDDYAIGSQALFVTGTVNPGVMVQKAGVAVAAGESAFWDADGNPVSGTAGSGAFTNVSTGNIPVGHFLEAAGAGVATVRINKLPTVDPAT